MANSEFDVAVYNTDELIPSIDAQLTVWQNMDDVSYIFDDRASRGSAATFAVPSRTEMSPGLGIGTSGTTNYNERRGSIVLDTLFNNRVIVGATELVLYKIESRKKELARSQASTICGKVETDAVKELSYGGFRYFGRSQTGTETFTIDDLRNAATIARNFSSNEMLFCYLPDATSTGVANSGYSQFLTTRNDETAQTNELQMINGTVNTRFFQTQLTQTHKSGTAARKKLTVSAVVANTYTYKGAIYAGTHITVTGATKGDTVVAGDIFTASTDGTFLRDDLTASLNILQGKIIANATADDKDLTFDINVDLLSAPAPGALPKNTDTVTKALAIADTLTIEGDHAIGFVFPKRGAKRASKPLGDPSPFHNGSCPYYEDVGYHDLNVRSWGGMDISNANSAMLQDGLYGLSVVAPYILRLVIPLSTLNLYAL